MKYLCIQKYYDNGKVSAWVESCTDSTEPYFIENKKSDEYGDIFDTKQEAEEYAEQSRLA